MSAKNKLGWIQKPETAKKLQERNKEVCFRYRGEDICAPIKQVNKKTVTIIDGFTKYRISYGSFMSKDEWVPYDQYKKTKQKSRSDPNFERSQNATIEPLPANISEDECWDHTVDELKDMCRDYGISGYSKHNKSGLVDLCCKSSLDVAQDDVRDAGICMDEMREIREGCSLSKAKCDNRFNAHRECVEDNVQQLYDHLNDHYELPKNKVVVNGSRTDARGGDTHGYYRVGSGHTRIYPYTKVRKQVVANKTFLNTVIHEWMHHYDYNGINLQKSIHTSGFFKRIGTLNDQLKPVLEEI